MAWNMHKIKVYSRLIGVGLVLLAVLIFILSNRQPVTISFLWWETAEIPMYGFILLVGLGSVVVFLVARRLRRVVAEFRTVLQEEKSRKRFMTQAEKAEPKES